MPEVLNARRDWFGQPRGLSVLAFTEMWEVFSFFGMKTLLIYYMTKQLMMPQAQASLIYGGYSGLAYFTPLLGGLISDRWLGRRNAVIAGGLIMALGHFMLTFPALFYPALATVAAGAGLYLPSLPSQIAGLFAADDPRRASAYSVYYVGMNLGALLAPLVCGTLGELLGWHWGFGAAGVGMVIGVTVYCLGARHLPETATRSPPSPAQRPVGGRDGLGSRFALIAVVAAVVVLFRAAYEQIGNTLALWLDNGVDRRAGDWTIPMTWFQSINPALIFLLTPLVMLAWTRQARAGREPSPLVKMSLGAGLLGLAYLVLAGVAAVAQGEGVRPGWIWFALFAVILTVGELFVMPVCLGLFGRLAPAGFAATAMAFWFMTGFGGNLLAGALGVLWSRLPPSAFFALMAAVAGLAAGLLWLLDPAARAAERRAEAARGPAEPATRAGAALPSAF
ncbi:peptide MFS transporter [Phenylobacterium sp.]|uniref:peptide MFS transporter n=1 Tax=Phenylobacterium sp. TaxID=1871053 RepID=UPI003565DE60